MKLSNKILTGLAFISLIGIISSNLVLKAEYDNSDKTDPYNWSYKKILEQPFKHVKIVGGNVAWVVFEPSKFYSVRVFKQMTDIQKKEIKIYISNDTLYVSVPDFSKKDAKQKHLRYGYRVRIFSPEITSITAFNADIELDKLKQKKLILNLKGNSKLGFESKLMEMDSIWISLSDTSECHIYAPQDKIQPPINFKTVQAYVKGSSTLNLGNSKIKSLQLSIDDNSAIQLSGDALKEFGKIKE